MDDSHLGIRLARLATPIAALVFLATFRLVLPAPIQDDDLTRSVGSYVYDPATGDIQASITTADGRVTRMAAGRALSVVMPPGFTLFPGAQPVEQVRVRHHGGLRVLLTMSSPRPAAELAEHYRTEAEAAGIAINVEISTDRAVTLAGPGFSFHARRNGDATRAQLSVER